MMHATDSELVGLTRAGDKASFGELVRRYQGLIYGLAYHRVGNFADAQDIAQEAFVKAFRSLDQLGQPERFAAWLKTIAANECRMWMRAQRGDVALEDAEELPSHASEAAERWKRHEHQAEIRDAVYTLPEKSRLVVTLHYLSGYSCREIGESLDMPENAVAQHLHRARRKLREMLISEIEEGYAMNRLPESFAQEVLDRVSLCPVVEGKFVTVGNEGDYRGFMMGVGESEPEKSFIIVWMRQDDMNDIVLGTIPGRTSENPKGRALDSALEVMAAFGIELKQVVLRLAGERQCRAGVDLKHGKTEMTLDMRPSDALGLAVRAKSPIYVEEPVVEKGNIGEDDVPTPDEPLDAGAYKTEFGAQGQLEDLRDKALELGLSPEGWIDTARFRKDEANGTLRIWLEAVPEREVTVDLSEYCVGVEMMFDLARRQGSTGLLHGDAARGWEYRLKFTFSMLDGDVRMRVSPVPIDDQPEFT